MDLAPFPLETDAASTEPAAILARAMDIAPRSRARAAALDRDGAFPADDIAELAAAGVLAATLPVALGGAGMGEGAAGGAWQLRLFHLLGQGNLAVGRVIEAHVNALVLVMRDGTKAQRRAAAADARAGRLFALWVTDTPGDPLRMTVDGAALVLGGGKSFCSAAGYADRALVTAREGDHDQMLLLNLGSGESVAPQGPMLQGMRAATTGAVGFEGCRVPAEARLGRPGDYLREPEFSTGAWRSSAVALGGLAALVAAARDQLSARGRDADPHQRARLGRAMIAHHTGWLWLQRAAELAQPGGAEPADAVGYVNLARTEVEAACLETLVALQRSLGLAAFLRANPVERLCRDLATYLRQPAPDNVLDEAAAHFMHRTLPGEHDFGPTTHVAGS